MTNGGESNKTPNHIKHLFHLFILGWKPFKTLAPSEQPYSFVVILPRVKITWAQNPSQTPPTHHPLIGGEQTRFRLGVGGARNHFLKKIMKYKFWVPAKLMILPIPDVDRRICVVEEGGAPQSLTYCHLITCNP